MRILPLPPQQLELLNRHEPLMVVKPELRSEVLRSLAEILLVAAEAEANRVEDHDETR
jgi:hypothetical protein